MHLFEHCKN